MPASASRQLLLRGFKEHFLPKNDSKIDAGFGADFL